MVSCHGRGGVSRGRPALYPGKRATPEANVNGARACACHKRRSQACISYSSVARRGAAAGCVACRPSPTNVQGQTPPLAHLWRGARLPLWAAPPRHAAARGPPPCAPVPPPPSSLRHHHTACAINRHAFQPVWGPARDAHRLSWRRPDGVWGGSCGQARPLRHTAHRMRGRGGTLAACVRRAPRSCRPAAMDQPSSATADAWMPPTGEVGMAATRLGVADARGAREREPGAPQLSPGGHP